MDDNRSEYISVNFHSFFSDLLSTLVGGMLLALFFFFVKEKLCPLPAITGQWYYEMQTDISSYNPYTGMVLRYVAMMWREGHTIRGTVEKIYENSSTGERIYVGKNRTRGIVEGYIEKKYLGNDVVYLHVVEEGHVRESTVFFSLICTPDHTMIGRFEAMVSNQSGTARWQRELF